eukprot:TRINITY_DN62549_c0_g1_i1.p1 TRINITY_DN62549_c0_g1~~TRINITY_DN62549_c0_g1_i1.p1  ORF type:complete len:325 (+),score=63.76 TRINITY_DN62549_c0_g1_i1:94-1068(+)
MASVQDSSCEHAALSDIPSLTTAVTKFMNKVNRESLDTLAMLFASEVKLEDASADILQLVADNFIKYTLRLGSLDVNANRKAELFGEAVKFLDERCNSGLAESVVAAFRKQLKGLLTASWKQEEGDVHAWRDGSMVLDESMDIRNKLMAIITLVTSLCLAGACSSDIVGLALREIGYLDFSGVDTVRDPDASIDEDVPMPQCIMLSGSMPAIQPVHGDTVKKYQERLASEFDLPAERLGLLSADGTRLPLSARLYEFSGEALSILVWHPALKEEHRAEAVCKLLSRLGPQLDSALVAEMKSHLEELRPQLTKRFQFMISDVLEA